MPINRIFIEALDPTSHSIGDFDCGVERLNNFIKLTAKKQQKDDVTQVYVAIQEGQSGILGYYSINAAEIDVNALKHKPKSLPENRRAPALFLGQIAVARDSQGQSIGSLLMYNVFETALGVSSKVGLYAIILDIISDGTQVDYARRKAFYEKFHFSAFEDNPFRMFITLKAVREIIGVQ